MSRRVVRVLIVGINYAPETTGIGPYTTRLAMGLIQRGHEVQVMTGIPHYPQWKRGGTNGAKWRFRTAENINGVSVRRFSHSIPRRHSWVGRVLMELTFGLQVLTCRWGHPDVVICVTPPLVSAAMVTIRARLTRRRPAIGILVHDLYARGVVETGMMSGLPARMVALFESTVLRLCDSIAVIHAGFRNSLTESRGVDGNKVREIRNWTHIDPPDPVASAAFRDTHGWASDDIVVLHAGNMGFKQGLENVVAAAELAARGDTRARFILLGDGNQRTSLEAAGAGVRALEFLSPVDDREFPAALGAADVLLVNERPGVAQMALPSKLTSYFGSGKPILAATDSTGYTAGELAESGAGICVPAGRPDLLLSEALRLAADRGLGDRLGKAGRRYCAERLTEEAALNSYDQWTIDLACARHAGRERVRP